MNENETKKPLNKMLKAELVASLEEARAQLERERLAYDKLATEATEHEVALERMTAERDAYKATVERLESKPGWKFRVKR